MSEVYFAWSTDEKILERAEHGGVVTSVLSQKTSWQCWSPQVRRA